MTSTGYENKRNEEMIRTSRNEEKDTPDLIRSGVPMDSLVVYMSLSLLGLPTVL